uniref:UPI0001A870D1 related cluster n=1 Tax=Saccharum spontaneum TaxID=62335 RepID=A0A678TQA6_SACSP|nr:UPI0001A870D1 related cluster [Saccharum spontaneum]
MDHLLIACVFCREVWYKVLQVLGLQQLTPNLVESFCEWWLQTRKRVPKAHRRGFDALVLLVSWMIWKGRRRYGHRLKQSWQSKKRRCSGVMLAKSTNMFLSTVVVYLRQNVVRLLRRRGGVTTAPLLQWGERSCSHAIIHWDALQQELARLWSPSAALLPVGDRKAHFSARLESALQATLQKYRTLSVMVGNVYQRKKHSRG